MGYIHWCNVKKYNACFITKFTFKDRLELLPCVILCSIHNKHFCNSTDLCWCAGFPPFVPRSTSYQNVECLNYTNGLLCPLASCFFWLIRGTLRRWGLGGEGKDSIGSHYFPVSLSGSSNLVVLFVCVYVYFIFVLVVLLFPFNSNSLCQTIPPLKLPYLYICSEDFLLSLSPRLTHYSL